MRTIPIPKSLTPPLIPNAFYVSEYWFKIINTALPGIQKIKIFSMGVQVLSSKYLPDDFIAFWNGEHFIPLGKSMIDRLKNEEEIEARRLNKEMDST